MKKILNTSVISLYVFICFNLPLSHSQTIEVKKFTLEKGIDIEIVEKGFDDKKFVVERCMQEKFSYVCKINGHVPFGIDGNLPKTFIESITLTVNQKIYQLNSEDMYDAWGNRPANIKGFNYLAVYCRNDENCTLRGEFSDGAGSFVAEWLIRSGISTRSILTNSEDIFPDFTHRNMAD
ncbi:hypothetical protein AAKU67_004233 [Oxalobacteraceae bacterium GrIS 2.11]